MARPIESRIAGSSPISSASRPDGSDAAPLGARLYGRGQPSMGRLIRLAAPENGRESFVDPPLLFRGDPAHEFAQAADIDGTNLLD